jgi:hypothetical protein
MRCALKTRPTVLSRVVQPCPASVPRPTFRGTSRLRDHRRSPRPAGNSARVARAPVGKPVSFLLQVLGHARPFAQLDDNCVLGRQVPEAMSFGAQRVGEHMRIAPIILDTGDGKPIAETVELLGVDGVDLKAAPAIPRGRLRLACHQQPITQFGQAGAAMGKFPSPIILPPASIRPAWWRLARPVDTDEPSRIVGLRSLFHSQSGHRDARHSLYWRSGRNSPPDLLRGQPAEASVSPGTRSAGGNGWLSTDWSGPASLPFRPAYGHAEAYRGQQSLGRGCGHEWSDARFRTPPLLDNCEMTCRVRDADRRQYQRADSTFLCSGPTVSRTDGSRLRS